MVNGYVSTTAMNHQPTTEARPEGRIEARPEAKAEARDVTASVIGGAAHWAAPGQCQPWPDPPGATPPPGEAAPTRPGP